MSPIGYHVVGRLSDRRVIAPTPPERRLVARIISEKFRGLRLLAFNLPDTHLHIEHCEDRAASGRLLQRVQVAIRRALSIPVAFERAEHNNIRDQWHLFKAFDYILRQQPRHELVWDPYHEASNLPDLLGMRLPGQHTATTVRQLLPRVKRAQLVALFGLKDLPEADGPAERVLEAALAALGQKRLNQRSDLTRGVLRAAMAIVEGRMPVAEISRHLGVSRTTLFRLRDLEPDARLVRAIKLQLGLRQIIAAAPTGSFVARGSG